MRRTRVFYNYLHWPFFHFSLDVISVRSFLTLIGSTDWFLHLTFIDRVVKTSRIPQGQMCDTEPFFLLLIRLKLVLPSPLSSVQPSSRMLSVSEFSSIYHRHFIKLISRIPFVYISHLNLKSKQTCTQHSKKCRNFTEFHGVEFCGKAQFPHSFGWIARNYAETVPFHKIFTPGN